MDAGRPTGHQIAFLIVISWLLMVPVSNFLEKALGLEGMWKEVFDRYFTALPVTLVFLAVAPVRRACRNALRMPIRREDRSEVALVTLVMPIHFFAYAGACAFWFHFTQGPLGLQQNLSGLDSAAHAMAVAMHPSSIVALMLAVIVGPVVEEILFRGFLYRAWAERYGWFAGMIMAAALFAMLHPNFFPAFLGGIAFTCIYRRTGSLWAAITVHAVGNLLAYYPLLGRFVFPRDMPDSGDLQRWTWHLAALVVTLVLWPAYVWMSGDRHDEPLHEEMPDGALPR